MPREVLSLYKSIIPGVERTFDIVGEERDNRAQMPGEILFLGCTCCSQTSDQRVLPRSGSKPRLI